MIVDLLEKLQETMNADLEVENIRKVKIMKMEYNRLLQEIQTMNPEFPSANSNDYTTQREELEMKNKILIENVNRLQTSIEALKKPISLLETHLESSESQIEKLQHDIHSDPSPFDFDVKLFKELGSFTEDKQLILQQDHLKRFKKINVDENPWDYLYTLK